MIDNLLIGIEAVFTINSLFFLLIGCLLGTAVGILPGIGSVITLSVLLPFTYGFDPLASIIMMSGIYYGSQYGGSTTSILLGIPGEPTTVMTCIDGHAMTQQGQASEAIIAAGISSFIAGFITIIIIAVAAPALSAFAFDFGPREFAALMLLGLIATSTIVGKDLFKGIGMAVLGMLVGSVGMDINTATERFVFGTVELSDGFSIGAVVVGVLGLPTLLVSLFKKENTISQYKDFKIKFSFLDFKRILPSSLRGTAIGSFLGVIPGGGAIMSSFAAYMVEKRIGKHKEQLGTGVIEGVAAPESANNAASQTSLIPMITLGIPENPVIALILSALLINGIEPGPNTINLHPDIFWGLLISMLVGNAMLLVFNIHLVKIWLKLFLIPKSFLYSTVIVIAIVGVYFIRNSWFDVATAIAFTALGLIFVYCDLEPAPLIFGYIIGPLFEENLRRTLVMSNGNFMTFIDEPISLVLISLALLLIIWRMIASLKQN